MESIRSFSFAKRIVVLFVLSFLVAMPMVGFVSSSAKASSTQDIMPIFNEDVYKKLTGHQHYYYLASCFRNNDIGKMGASDVDGWDFFNNDDRYDAAIGAMYGGDGSMDCKNGDNVSRAAGAVGTTLKAREAFCKMENAKYGGENVDTDAAYRVCVSGSTPDAQWDDDGPKRFVLLDQSDNLVKQYESFRDNMGFKDPGLDDATQYMRAYSTLINGCNLKAEETVYDSWDKAVEGAKGESEIMPFVTMEKKGKNIVLQYRTGIGSRGDSSVILVATTGLYEPARGGAHGMVSAAKYPRTMRTCDQLAVDTNTYAAKYLQYVNTNGYTEGGNPDGGGGDPKSSCSVEGVGWIICPAATFIGMLNDSLFGIIKHLLEINPKMFDAEGSNRSTYTVWESIRSIGNVAFIFAFLIIIYSQITGAGVTNYGIKRLLPKLIIAVILVNVSFWLCAILVDVSNVVGTSLYSLLDVQLKDVVAKGAGNNLSFWADLTGFLLAGGTGVLAAGGAALTVGTYGFFGALALLVPTAVAALFAFLVVVFVLVARQALVIILVVVSPLAFVALLLPNTESWFAKWRKTFFSLLLIYPAVALLFGGSQLAAAVIREGTTDVLVYILSLVVQVIPLFALPTLMKLSGGLLGQIAGRINNPNKGPFDRMKKAGRNYAERRKGFRAGDNIERVNKVRTGSGGVLGKEGSRRRRMAAWASGIGSVNSLDAAEKDKYGKIASEGAARSYVAKRALQDEQYATALAGGDPKLAKHVQGYATQAVKEEQKKDIAAARSLLSDRNAAEEDATGASTFVKSMVDEKQQGHEMAAYAAEIAARGPGRHFQDAIEASRHIKDAEKRRLVQNELITNMREDHAGVSDEMRGLMNVGALDESAQVGVSGTGEQFTSIYDSSFDQRIQTKASAETVVSMKAHDIELARRLIRSGQITDPSLTKLTELMDLAELNDTTKVKIKGQVGSMFEEARALAAKRSQG